MMLLSASRLADLWDEMRNSYWLLPAVMMAGAIGLAVGMSYLDLILPEASGGSAGWATAMQAGAARTILATLAGSMATIVSIVFSITVVALQLASSQFGPHVLRSFLTDRGSQASLGTLLGSFTYSLLVIVVVRGRGGFVPYASTYAGILIGIIAVGVLIYFINHITKLLRAEDVIASLAREVIRATERVFPEQIGEGDRTEREEAPAPPPCFAANARVVRTRESGYIRQMDDSGLMRLAKEHDLLIRLDVRPGDFLVRGAALMAAAPSDWVDDATADTLRRTVLLGQQRTPEQDVPFALQHLEEVAIRSMSPSINAPYTAIPAIDQLGAGLCWLAERRMPSPRRKDDNGRLRVLVMRPPILAALARDSLGPIAHAAAGDARVLARVIEVALLIGDRAPADADQRELREFAETLTREAEASVRSDGDRQILRAALDRGGLQAARAGRIA